MTSIKTKEIFSSTVSTYDLARLREKKESSVTRKFCSINHASVIELDLKNTQPMEVIKKVYPICIIDGSRSNILFQPSRSKIKKNP